MIGEIMATCSVEDCDADARGFTELCNKHRLRLQRHGDVNHARKTPQYTLPCMIEGCELRRVSRGFCGKHTYRANKYGSPHIAAFHVEKHGMTGHPLYSTWTHMRLRCHSPGNTGYELYGARGIQVCDRWRSSFSAFIADVGERPSGCTLDRIDNDGNYEPGNVRWALPSTQIKNQRTRRDNTSGHKGVSWDRSHRQWRAYKGGGRTRVELGRYDNLSEAIKARHRATVNDPYIMCCEGRI